MLLYYMAQDGNSEMLTIFNDRASPYMVDTKLGSECDSASWVRRWF
jgi:hypothetical protein